MKRWFTLLFLLRLFAQLIAGCAPAATPTPTLAPVEIIFYKRGYVAEGTDVTSVTNAQAAAAFEKQHPDIKIKIVGVPWGTEGTEMIRAALSAGTGIHVLSVNTFELPAYARQGLLSSLDEFLTPADQADFYDSALQAARVDGNIYAWPLWVTAVAIYANPELLAERAVTPPTLENPWDWDSFVDAARRLTFTREDGTQVYGFSASSSPGLVVYTPLLYIDGGRVLSPDARRFIQDSPEALSALQKLSDLANLYQVTPPDFGNVDQAGVREQFRNGTLAMVMDTPNFISEFEKLSEPFVVLPSPVGALGAPVTSGAFGFYGVANIEDARVLSAAHEYARYLTSSQVAKDVAGYQQAPGLRRSNTSYSTSEARGVITRLVGYGIYEPPVAISTDLRQRYELALQAVLLGQKTPQQAMAEIAPDYQLELDTLVIPPAQK